MCVFGCVYMRIREGGSDCAKMRGCRFKQQIKGVKGGLFIDFGSGKVAPCAVLHWDLK